MKKTEEEVMHEVRTLAHSKRCFVVTRQSNWLLYRKAEHKNIFIGKRTSINGLLKLLKDC